MYTCLKSNLIIIFYLLFQKTPTGQKRSYSHLLPAPEPSPEGGYVGQHSQGIGGHYADSYRASGVKRQRLETGYTNTGSSFSGY